MARNTHHRQRDHEGVDLVGNIQTNSQIGSWASGTNLSTVLTALGSGSGINLIINEGGGTLQTSVKGVFVVPYAGEITQYTLLADQSTTSSVVLKKMTYAAYNPAGGTTIGTASTSAANKAQDATLSGWTTTFSAGDIYAVDVTVNDNATWLTLELRIRRT
jgi:hypothetical protein